MTASWEQTATAKRNAIYEKIPQEWRLAKIPTAEEQKDVTGTYVHQFLSEKEIEITETDAVGIVEKTTSGAWTAVEVTKAFCHRAAIAHQLLNCLLEIFFDAAIADAQAYDDYFAKNKAPIGPLHGLPVSLKDQFHVKGVETSMGYVGWIGTFEGKKGTGKEKVFESLMTTELKDLGAVLYCKTSVPMTLMTGETINNIVGFCLNPKDRFLSAGGSSGGEGALVGFKGSPVGFGTDIGGSIRIPAAFNGMYGLRPSAGRLPYEGMANSWDGQNTILSVVGPIATSARSLKLLAKSILSTKPWLHDPLVHELPWRPEQEQIDTSKLTFGVIKHDGIVTPTPPVRRAVDMVVKALEKSSHEVIDWSPTPNHEAILKTAFKTWIYDGAAHAHESYALSGEPAVPQLANFGDEPGPQYNASQIAAVNVTKRQQQKEYMEYWNSTASKTKSGAPVDVVISPVAPYPAARRELFKYYGYSVWVNLLDYTSVVVPVTVSSKELDPVDKDFKAANTSDQEAHDAYDPDIYDGAAVSIQLVGRRHQEEKTIAIAEYVAKVLKDAAT
ncbi:amidase [Rhizodiscina lignyota]|uniref:amidase n=1 Tax=Rhizodiscina lignyota TaxID=1504668 RepID=A0A9P4IEF0_9PEZI|nr:amidase [Rhizodiscina lignyota]